MYFCPSVALLSHAEFHIFFAVQGHVKIKTTCRRPKSQINISLNVDGPTLTIVSFHTVVKMKMTKSSFLNFGAKIIFKTAISAEFLFQLPFFDVKIRYINFRAKIVTLYVNVLDIKDFYQKKWKNKQNRKKLQK